MGRARPVLRRIAFIVFAQRVGLTLDEFGHEPAQLPPDRAPNRADWAKLSTTWRTRVDDRIAGLQRLRVGLTECIGCGCLSLDRCNLANPGRSCRRLPARPMVLDRGPANAERS
jgi:MerR family transcriptional regulator, redox-sensitive transcriptional activator SoxR